jgi:hypothetical protein
MSGNGINITTFRGGVMKIKLTIFAVFLVAALCVLSAPVLSADISAAPGLADCESMPMAKERFGGYWAKPGFDMKQFGTLVIEKPGVSSLAPSTRVNYDEFASMFHSNLTEKIKATGFFSNVAWNRPAEGGRMLVLRSEFTEMNPGSTAARWMVGYGAGRGAVTVKASLVADGKEVVMCWHSRHMDAGSPSGNLLLSRGMAVMADRLFLHIDRLYNTGR